MPLLSWSGPRTEPSEIGERTIYDSTCGRYRVARSRVTLAVGMPDVWYAILMVPRQKLIGDAHRNRQAAETACNAHAGLAMNESEVFNHQPEESTMSKKKNAKTAETKSRKRLLPLPALTDPAAKKAFERRTKPTKTTTEKPPKSPAGDKKMSCLDAASKVLGENGGAMTSPEMIEAMARKGYWSSPGGKTPEATLYAAIIREIGKKGKDARFAKSERGKFERTVAD